MGSDCPATECPLLVQLNPDHGTTLFFPKGPESLSINFEVEETPSNSEATHSPPHLLRALTALGTELGTRSLKRKPTV